MMHSAARRGLMTLAAFLALALTAAHAASPIDHGTLTGKLIMGYQGWFACPGDAAKRGWVHWSDAPGPASAPTVDMLPDVSELPAAERCQSGLTTEEGIGIDLYSSQNPATVDRHFAWMEQYRLDGVALQRFATEALNPPSHAAIDHVLDNVRRAAEVHGRVFFVMYDLSGLQPRDYMALIQDWTRLQASGITSSPAYLRHRGHPLLGLWGLGFAHRPMTPADAQGLLAQLTQASNPGGVTLLGGLPSGWRTGTGDADPDPGWKYVWPLLGVLSPWTVGRYTNAAEADRFRDSTIVPDLPAAAAAGADYMPVVFPGFSWANLMRARHNPDKAVRNQIPRDCGRFYWRQVRNALEAGAGMLYSAMFDEVDEGTAMFKLVPFSARVPVNPPFVALDADGCNLQSDWYLRLAGAATQAVRGGLPPKLDLPPMLTIKDNNNSLQ